MKKFFRKSLACIIAVMMIATSLPFTALAGQTVNDFTVKEATAYGTFESDSDYNDEAHYKQIYKNVLYSPSQMAACYTSGPVSADGKDKIYLTSKVYYGNTVLLYSGGTTPAMGIGFAVVGYSKPWNYNYNNVRTLRCNLIGDTQGISFRDSNWHGADGRMNYTYTMFGQSEVIGTSSDLECVQGQKGYYGNVLQYTGGDFTADFKKINLGFEYVVKTNEGSTQTHQTGTIDSASIYVLNYKKLVDKVDDVKKDLSALNTSIYEESSLNNYYTAINNMFAFDPSLYDYDANTEQAVKDAASDMDSLIDAVDTAYNNLKYNYVFKRINGDVLGTIPAKNYAEALTATSAYFYDPSPSTAKKSDGKGNHTWTTYAWPNTVADGVYEIIEVATPHSEACKYVYTDKDQSTHTTTCSNCDLNVDEPHTNNGSGSCRDCGRVLLDTSALDSAKTKAENIHNAGNADGKYVADTYEEFEAVYDRVTKANPTTQDEVNSLATELLEAINTLRKATLTVRLDKQVDNTVTKGQPESWTYGEVKEFEVTDGDVEKWVITTDNGTDQPATTTEIKTGDNKITLVITRNVEVVAQLAVNSTTQQNITKVVFRGRNNSVVAIKYIEAGTQLDTSSVNIPEIPFYRPGSWDKTQVTGLDNGGVITVRAQYTFKGQEADKCGIHFTSFDGGVKKFDYDSLVKLNDNSSRYFGMYEDKDHTKLLTYFENDEFYAPHNSDIYVAPVDSKAVTASVGVTGSYSGTIDDKRFATFNCKFYVPDGATVLEWGIKATAGGKTITFKSDTKSKLNEYSFRIKFAQDTSMTSVDAQAYIIYELNGKKETVLSNNTVTQNF